MPRRPRLFVPGAIYHVYCRVARGEFVFDDGREADEFVESGNRCLPHESSVLRMFPTSACTEVASSAPSAKCLGVSRGQDS